MKFELQMGGSGYGITSALKYFRCPEMWHRDNEAPKTLGGGGMLAGTIYHAFLEIYRNLQYQYDPATVEFVYPEGVQEPFDWHLERNRAEIAFHAYQDKYSPSLGGTLLHAEYKMQIGDLTAKMDAIYDLPEGNELGLQAGIWVVDDKLLSGFGDSTRSQYRYSPQGAWYKEALRLDGVYKDVAGLCFHVATKTKEVKFYTVEAAQWAPETLSILLAKMQEPRVRFKSFNCNDAYSSCRYVKDCLAGGK